MYISSMSDVFEKFHLNIISDTLDQLGKSMKKRKLSSFDIEVNLNIYLIIHFMSDNNDFLFCYKIILLGNNLIFRLKWSRENEYNDKIH